MNQSSSILTAFISIFILTLSNGAKILFISAPTSDSHRKSMLPFATRLAQRGHHIGLVMEALKGFVEVPNDRIIENISPIIDMPQFSTFIEEFKKNVWKADSFQPIAMILPWLRMGGVHKQFIDQYPRQYNDKLINGNWSMIFVDALFSPGGMMLPFLTNASHGTFFTTNPMLLDSWPRQSAYPASYIPSLFIPRSAYDHRQFTSRLVSIFCDVQEILIRPFIDFLAFRPFKALNDDGVSLLKFYQKSTLSIVSFPKLLDYNRPIHNDDVYIGGSCPKFGVKPLESELDSFINDPLSKGTIVVAFGHMASLNSAPKLIVDSLFKALNNLSDYRIIVQYKGDCLQRFGHHIRCMGWLPQESLLQNEKTKLFVSHGGLKSIMESICSTVPAVVIPMFAEQIRNAHLFVKSGSGRVLLKSDLKKSTKLLATLNDALSNDKYSKAINRLRTYFSDVPVDPIDLGIFWVEFFEKRKTIYLEPWFKRSSRNLYWFQYFLLDVIALELFSLWLTALVLRYIYRKTSKALICFII